MKLFWAQVNKSMRLLPHFCDVSRCTKYVYGLITLLLTCATAYGQSAFRNVTSSAGIDHSYIDWRYGGGVAANFNGDGHIDLFITSGSGFNNKLYLNRGNASFRDASLEAGLTDTLASVSVVCGDIDNDGDLDLYVSNYLGPNKLYVNDGNASFVDMAREAGVDDRGPGSSIAMADYDSDGFLDIYLLNRSSGDPCIFFRNNGDGTFTDVTTETKTRVSGWWLGVGFFDFDLDRDLDLFLVNEFGVDIIFRNDGNGSFTNYTSASKLGPSEGMGFDFADYDNDGDFDIHIADFNHDPLLRNNGDGTFTNVARDVGVVNAGIGWGVNFLDYDNDGDKDLFVVNGAVGEASTQRDIPNMFYRNRGDGTFESTDDALELSYVTNGRGSVAADFNNDGYVDLFFVGIHGYKSSLFLNSGGSNNWIVLRLEGTRSNRSAVGARVELRAGSMSQVDEVRAGSSYASMQSLELEFGIGTNRMVDAITVFWPSGQVQRLFDINPNQILTITEPSEDSENRNEISPDVITLSQNYPNPFNGGTDIPY